MFSQESQLFPGLVRQVLELRDDTAPGSESVSVGVDRPDVVITGKYPAALWFTPIHRRLAAELAADGVGINRELR